MRSFKYQADNRRQVYLALAGSIESQLRDAYAKRFEAGDENQASLAKKLGVHRSVVNRRLTGRQKNMTIESVANLVWALGQCVKVDIFDPMDKPSNEHRIIPQHSMNSMTIDAGKLAAVATTRIRAGAAESQNSVVVR